MCCARSPPLQLSPECQDLLTRIFHIKEEERITVAQIKEHPWFIAPLSARFQEADDAMKLQQEAIERRLASCCISEVRRPEP